MTVLQAILPVLGLLAGGACVGAFVYFGKRKHEKDRCLSHVNISLCGSYSMAENGFCQALK